MASNKFLTAVMAVSATVSVAAFAGCAPGTPGLPTGSATPKPTTSGTPAPGTSATPTPTGSAVTATPTPTAIPTNADTSQRATVHGVVFDDLEQRLTGVTVTGKVLGGNTFANGSDTLTATTQVGSYALNGTPTGETILVTVTKSGYTTRQQTIVPLANLTGDPAANALDFGQKNNALDETFAMSDKPEVSSMTPTPDSTGVDPATSFTLTWSEPVNTSDVENFFAVAVANDSYTLSSSATGIKLVQEYFPSGDSFGNDKGDGTSFNADKDKAQVATPTYDQSAFNFAWSNNNQTVTATFRPGFKLPTDKDASKIPQYAVGFKGNVKDAAGSGTRSEKYFRVSPAQIGKNGYRFTVAADTTAPKLNSVSTQIDGFNNTNDAIRYQFSETMVLFPAAAFSGAAGVAIPKDGETGDARKAGNLEWVKKAATDPKPSSGDVNKAVVTPRLYAVDATNSTIEADTNQTALTSGDTIWGEAKSDIEDPAGNKIDTGSDNNIKSSKAI